MTDTLQALIDAGILRGSPFPPNSRYHGVTVARSERPDGTAVAYLRRRFLPQPDSLALLQEHVVVQGDRLDNIAAAELGDPTQFWRICDANGALRPEELVETPGRRLRVTLPAGIPGPGDA
ncbi:LysM domain-containing protein [Roseomonas sp. GCM10028921]